MYNRIGSNLVAVYQKIMGIVIQYPRYLNLETQNITCSPEVILNFGGPMALDDQSASVFE